MLTVDSALKALHLLFSVSWNEGLAFARVDVLDLHLGISGELRDSSVVEILPDGMLLLD